MMGAVVIIGYVGLSLALLIGLYRLLTAPSVLDRLLAFESLSIAIVGMIILFAVQENTLYFLEMILIFCLLGFTSTVAFMDYMFRRKE